MSYYLVARAYKQGELAKCNYFYPTNWQTMKPFRLRNHTINSNLRFAVYTGNTGGCMPSPCLCALASSQLACTVLFIRLIIYLQDSLVISSFSVNAGIQGVVN